MPASAAATCTEGSYAYAGFDSRSTTSGVGATIEQAGPLEVRAGHVAGWVGIVEPGSGSAWLQAGLSAMPGDRRSGLYYEVAFPGHAPVYHEIARDIGRRERHRLAVLEVRGRADWWRVWLDGEPATAPLRLRGSHGRWIAQVLGESWAASAAGTCNAFAYAFSGVSFFGADGGRLGLFGAVREDANYTVVRRSRWSFVAETRP
jgi:hypothetical protein